MYVYIYAYNNSEIEAMALKESKEEHMGGVRGRKWKDEM